MALGRISGPLLKSNLVRDGVDLAFETDLLYIDVNNARIGVNNASPTTDLDVNGTSRTTDLIVSNQIDVGNISVTGNTISSDLNTLSFQPSGDDPVVYHSKLNVDDIQITGNKISSINSNADIELRPNGTGTVELLSDTNISGNLHVSGNINTDGNITIGGNIVIGDEQTDTIEFNASIQSDIVPDSDDTYDLGANGFRWRDAYINNLYTTTLNLNTLDIGDFSFRDNEISTPSDLDMILTGNGSGGVQLGNLQVSGNVITNIANNQITQITQTGTGYFKIAGTNGFVPPRGTDGERPTAYAVVGMTRYNTNSKALEVWDGAAWASPAGASGAVSEIQANDIAASFALMLG